MPTDTKPQYYYKCSKHLGAVHEEGGERERETEGHVFSTFPKVYVQLTKHSEASVEGTVPEIDR